MHGRAHAPGSVARARPRALRGERLRYPRLCRGAELDLSSPEALRYLAITSVSALLGLAFGNFVARRVRPDFFHWAVVVLLLDASLLLSVYDVNRPPLQLYAEYAIAASLPLFVCVRAALYARVAWCKASSRRPSELLDAEAQPVDALAAPLWRGEQGSSAAAHAPPPNR